MKKLLSLLFALLICACASATPVPVWKGQCIPSVGRIQNSFLTDKEASTEPHFVKARREIAASNDLRLLTIAYLTKYALHTASTGKF